MRIVPIATILRMVWKMRIVPHLAITGTACSDLEWGMGLVYIA